VPGLLQIHEQVPGLLDDPGRILRQTVIAMDKGAVLAEHENPGEATAHVLRGRVRLSAGGCPGRSGGLLAVPDARHSLGCAANGRQAAVTTSPVQQAVLSVGGPGHDPCRHPGLNGVELQREEAADGGREGTGAPGLRGAGAGRRTRVLVERIWRSLKASAGFDQHSDQGVIRLGAGLYRDPQLVRGRKRTREGERMTASMDHERTGAPSSPATEHEDGGDSAYWAQRVCPERGRLDQAEHPHECEACLPARSRSLWT
jgi:quercetin dioxygenase-like cupin family protein